MKIEIKNLDAADEIRPILKGRIELCTVGGLTVGRATYEPGWKWSEHVGRAMGQEWCEVEHVVLVVEGRMVVAMRDGEQVEIGRGDLCFIPPGHDSWVVGDERYVSLHFVGTEEYARKT
ncbi:MAG: cupin domain-containing protein [Gemmatimonadota bacterium]